MLPSPKKKSNSQKNLKNKLHVHLHVIIPKSDENPTIEENKTKLGEGKLRSHLPRLWFALAFHKLAPGVAFLIVHGAPSLGSQGTVPAELDLSAATGSTRLKRSSTSPPALQGFEDRRRRRGKEEDALCCNGRNRLWRGDEIVSLVAAGGDGPTS